MKVVPVHRGQSTLEALVDDEDYEFLVRYRWSASVSNRAVYANTSIPTDAGFKCVSMHRMVIGDAQEDWEVTLGWWPLEVQLENGKSVYIIPDNYRRFRRMSVDHIDGNGLNNTRATLRPLSCLDQAKNRNRFWF